MEAETKGTEMEVEGDIRNRAVIRAVRVENERMLGNKSQSFSRQNLET